jgi:hypothetical protein
VADSTRKPEVSIGAVETSGSRFYTVSDRPVAVVPTQDGGADCVVFDFATGELVPDRSYFGYVTPGSGKDVDALTEAEFEARLAACRAEAGVRAAARLRHWAQRLCATAGPAADVAAALGLSGPASRGDVMVDPPPRGCDRMRVITVRGDGAAIEVQPTGSLLTRAVLDAEFGLARELPILPDSWLEGHVGYQVTVQGAGAQCLISAHFRRQAAVRVVLRRHHP